MLVHLTKARLVRFGILTGIILVVAAITIGLSVSLTRKKKNNNNNQNTTTSFVTTTTITTTIGSSMTSTTTTITTVSTTTTTTTTTEETLVTCRFIEQPPTYVQTSSRIEGEKMIGLTDLDGDHRLDLIYASPYGEGVEILMGHGNGSFDRRALYTYDEDELVTFFFLIDANHDNHTDIIYQFRDEIDYRIRYGFGNGSFHSETNEFFPKYFASMLIVFGDVNNDTYLDVMIDGPEKGSLSIFLSNGNGSFIETPVHTIDTLFHPIRASFADLNNDQILDVLWVIEQKEFGVAFGIGDGTFKEEHAYIVPYIGTPMKSFTGDLNGDNFIDIIFFYHSRSFLVALNNGDETFRVIVEQFDLSSNNFQLGFIDDDDHLDLIAIHPINNVLKILFGLGNGSFSKSIHLFENKNLLLFELALGDFNNDQQLDIVIFDGSDETLIVLINACD